MPSNLTRDQIISLALEKAGDRSLTLLARDWLNNLLDRLYEDYGNWPFLEKPAEGTLSSGQTSVDLPSDFSDVFNRRGLRIEDSDGNFKSLELLVPEFFDTISDPDRTGTPGSAILDLNELTWRPYPLANQNFTWHLRYRRKPSRLTSDTAPVFPNEKILIQGVFAEALDYAGDPRAKPEFTVLRKMIERYKKGKNISPAQGGKMRFNPKTFLPVPSFR